MTEIPEHLLKRSKAAKAKVEGGEAPADGASTPATGDPSTAVAPAARAAAPAKAAPAAPPPPKPDPAYVAAAKARPKVPFWAMATLSILPLWVFMYARGLTPKEAKVSGPLGEGAEIYAASGSSCHGAGGEGVSGLGYQFSAGEVLKTFPHIEDQLRFVSSGSLAYGIAGIDIYGNPDREGGPHITQQRGIMPAQADALSETQILAVVCHERYTLGGADPVADSLEEYEKWCSPEAAAWVGLEDGSLTFDNIADQLEGTLVVGTEPAAGSAPDAAP